MLTKSNQKGSRQPSLRSGLDEYINFFESSIHLPSNHNSQKPAAEAIGGVMQTENTSSRQESKYPAAADQTVVASVAQNNLNLMSSPLASYLYYNRQGTSASQQQAISVLSDYKEPDQTKTCQKGLQSPPEFRSPAESFAQQSTKRLDAQTPMGLNYANHIVPPTTRTASISNLMNVSQSTNIGSQPPYQFCSSYQNNSNSQKQEIEKRSFSKFYEKTTVSPHSRLYGGGLSSLHNTSTASDNKLQLNQYQHFLSQVQPFCSNSSQANFSRSKRKNDDSSNALIDKVMEQISAIIDYDINDYLPPSSNKEQQNVTEAKRLKQNPMITDFLMTSTPTASHYHKKNKPSAGSRLTKGPSHRHSNDSCTRYLSQQSTGQIQTSILQTTEDREAIESLSERCELSNSSSDFRRSKKIQSRRRRKVKRETIISSSQSSNQGDDDEEAAPSCSHKRRGRKQKSQTNNHRISHECDRHKSSAQCNKSGHQDWFSSRVEEVHSQQLKINLSSGFDSQERVSSLEASDRQKLAMMILQGDSNVQVIKQDWKYPKESPRFQIQMMPQSEKSEKTQFHLLHSLINTSDFKSEVRQPVSSRAPKQTSHILISQGNTIIHSRNQSVDAIPQAAITQTEHNSVSQFEDSELIHLTQMNFGPLIHTVNTVADVSNSGITNEMQSSSIELKQNLVHNETVQTSFSQLYRPYAIQSKKTGKTSDQPLDNPTHYDLNIECQSTFAPHTQDSHTQKHNSSKQSLSLCSEKPKQASKHKVLSLVDSVILIQRTYRKVLAARIMLTSPPGLFEEQEPSIQFSNESNTFPVIKALIRPNQKSTKSTQEADSSDIELPEMFEYDNWWLQAETPMTDECLAAFLKKHL